MRLSIQYGPVAMLAYNSLLSLVFSTNNRCTRRLCNKNGPFVSSGRDENAERTNERAICTLPICTPLWPEHNACHPARAAVALHVIDKG